MKIQSNLKLNEIGITQDKNIYRNLPVEVLIEESVINGEGVIGMNGALMVDTGVYTGRSPDDKYFVDEPSSNNNIWWGSVNRKVKEHVFDELYEKVTTYYNDHCDSNTYIFDGFAGADPDYRLNVRILAKKSWQAHFCHNMFIRPTAEELAGHEPQFTVIHAPQFKAISCAVETKPCSETSCESRIGQPMLCKEDLTNDWNLFEARNSYEDERFDCEYCCARCCRKCTSKPKETNSNQYQVHS